MCQLSSSCVARHDGLRIDGFALVLLVWGAAFAFCVVAVCVCNFAAAFDEDVSLWKVSEMFYNSISVYRRKKGLTYLQRIFPTEALIAVQTRERLHSQMDPLMPLEIVIPVEALRALIAFEGAVVCLWGRMSEEMGHASLMRGVCCVSTVETCHHAWVHAAD